MARYFIDLDGGEKDTVGADFPTLDDDRNAAITKLGTYLQDHPEYAYAQHWRVDVRDSSDRLLLHTIVTTVNAPPPLNIASFDPHVQELWNRR